MPDSEYGSCESLPDSITPRLSASSSNHTVDDQSTKSNNAPTLTTLNNGAPNASRGTKITGTARVTRVSPKYAFIQSERYGSIFVLPHTISHSFPNQNRFVDLTQFIRVDEVVHFVATEQTNGVNNCRWIAQKLTLPYTRTTPIVGLSPLLPYAPLLQFQTATVDSRPNSGVAVGTGSDDIIENVRGVVLTVHEKYAFLMTGLYGRVYLPLSACFSSATDENGAHMGRSEFQKLTDSFLPDDLVIFDACKQSEKNGCKFTVTKVKQIISEAESRRSFLVDPSVQPNVAESGYSTSGDFDLSSIASALVHARKSSEAGSSVSGVDSTIQQASIPLRTGEIYRLTPQFGFIKCYPLGSVYFTLSNYDGILQTQSTTSGTNTTDLNDIAGGDTIADNHREIAQSSPDENSADTAAAATVSSLLDVLTLGDRVRFIASRQPRKNGCDWRACRVQKLPSSSSSAHDDFNDLAEYLRLDDVDYTNNSPNGCESPENSKTGSSPRSKIKVAVVEIATQTDVHLWNAFLAAQSPPSPRIKNGETTTLARSVQTQTIPPPETMVLNALRRNADFKRALAERFPDLIRYVDKNA